MNSRLRPTLLGFCLTLAGAVVGCSHGPPQVAPPEAPVVPMSQPVQREVIDYVDFTGRTDAVNTANIVPRVTGYLVKMPFKEGSLVKKDDLLFEVDPRPYKAQLDQALGQVTLNEASLKLAKSTYERDRAVASGCDLRLEALSPRCRCLEERWKSIVLQTERLGSRGDCGPVAQNLASRRRDGPLDLWWG